MADRSALVTGATGFIGSRLAAALVARGWTVSACGRRERPDTLAPSITYRTVDLAGDDDLEPLLAGVTHLFHLAGASSSLGSASEMHRDNVVATERLVDAALAAEDLERLVYMSSTSVYGEEVQLPSPVPEEVEPRPSRAYGKAKWASEQVVWAADARGLPVIVLRPVSVFGPGNVKLLASAVLDVAIERFAAGADGADSAEPVPVPAEAVEQRLVHLDDLLRATMHLALHPWSPGQAYNVVFPSYPSSHHVAQVIAGELGVGIELSDDPDAGLSYEERRDTRDKMLGAGMRPDILLTRERFRFMRKGNINNRLSIDALLSTGFQFADVDLDTGIRATIAWYQGRRWIV
jgi:nucleoside-diphosphate-sugar epimerase